MTVLWERSLDRTHTHSSPFSGSKAAVFHSVDAVIRATTELRMVDGNKAS